MEESHLVLPVNSSSILGKSISKSLTVGHFEITDLAVWTLVESADVVDNEAPRSKLGTSWGILPSHYPSYAKATQAMGYSGKENK